jgi:hypothetical protein
MKRHAAYLAPLLGVLGGIGSRPAHAADVACRGMTIEARSGFRARFPGLIERVRDELAAHDDIDVCARVELSARDGTAIGVDVTLPDGRAASRTAARREDVVLTLQALLLVPEPLSVAARPAKAVSSPPSAPTAPVEAVVRVAPIPANPRALDQTDRDAPSSARRPSFIRIELSAIGGARIGNGQTSVGLGAVSFLDIGGWLVGFQGRADRYQSLTGGQPEAALELAMPLGKRFQFQRVALDVLAGPAVAMMGFSISETVTAPVGTAPPREEIVRESTAGPVPRLFVGARLGFSPRSVLRTFIGVDGAIGPSRATTTVDANVPELPIWTLGLALGATVGTE